MDLNLKGKTVVVTGGSKGIGYAIAKEFLQEGANVFITGRDKEALKKAQRELSQFGNLEVCPGDGTNEKDVEAAAKLAASLLAARCSTCGRSNIYGSMKAGLLSLTRNYAGEYKKEGIRVNAVLPGYTRTPLVEKGFTGEELKRLLASNIAGRMAEPVEIAKPVVFLASDAASYINGEALEVGGGQGIVLNPWYSEEKNY